MKLSQLIVSFLMITNKIFIEAAIKRNTNNNRLNVKQFSTPVVVDDNFDDVYHGSRTKSDETKAMLMQCPRKNNEETFLESKGHDLCQDKILLTIAMEKRKKIQIGDDVEGHLELQDELKRKFKAKLMIPLYVEQKKAYPVLLYPMKFFQNNSIPTTTTTKSCENPNTHPFKQIVNNDVNKIAHKYFNLGANGMYADENPFNYLRDESQHLNGYENVLVRKRQRDPIRACQCNSCPKNTGDEMGDDGCHNCREKDSNETKTSPTPPKMNDDQLFPSEGDKTYHISNKKPQIFHGNGIVSETDEWKTSLGTKFSPIIGTKERDNRIYGQSDDKIPGNEDYFYSNDDENIDDEDDYNVVVPSSQFVPEKDEKSYDLLMHDQNLTPNDKIQFLAANFDHPRPIFNRYFPSLNVISKPVMRKKREFYDDLTSSARYDSGGEWYRYLMANFPQLSIGEQSREKENINKERVKEKQKNLSHHEQKNHSIDKLCISHKCVFAIPLQKKDIFFTETKECLESSSSSSTRKRKLESILLSLCAQEAVDYVLLPFSE